MVGKERQFLTWIQRRDRDDDDPDFDLDFDLDHAHDPHRFVPLQLDASSSS